MKKYLLTMICGITIFTINAQSELAFSQFVSAADESENSNLQVSWVLGDVFLADLIGTSVVSTNIKKTDQSAKIDIQLWGNPTYDNLIINFSEPVLLHAQLRDAKGQLLRSRIIDKQLNAVINIEDLTAQVYYLSIYEADHMILVKTFKVVKQ